METFLEAARTSMVKQQVRAWDVLDPAVLDALAAVPREAFVPERYRQLAFADVEIPLPHGQRMLTPQLVGRALLALELKGTDAVLEVGTGSGFLTACLAHLAGSVDSLEIFPDLATAARERLRALRFHHVSVTAADVFAWEPSRTYDAIVVTGSVPRPEHRFADWLAPGGRLFEVVGEPPAMEACLIRRAGAAECTTTSLFETVVPPLLNGAQPARFVF